MWLSLAQIEMLPFPLQTYMYAAHAHHANVVYRPPYLPQCSCAFIPTGAHFLFSINESGQPMTPCHILPMVQLSFAQSQEISVHTNFRVSILMDTVTVNCLAKNLPILQCSELF